MDEPKRLFLRIEECLTCDFDYDFFGEAKRGSGIILDLGGGGLRMITKEMIKKGAVIDINIAPPMGPLEVKGEILGSALENYVTDKQRDMFYTTRVRFKNTPLPAINAIIAYVHKCHKERREARYRKHK
jgi:hypothetical protein